MTLILSSLALIYIFPNLYNDYLNRDDVDDLKRQQREGADTFGVADKKAADSGNKFAQKSIEEIRNKAQMVFNSRQVSHFCRWTQKYEWCLQWLCWQFIPYVSRTPFFKCLARALRKPTLTFHQMSPLTSGLGSNTYFYLQIQIQIQIWRTCICICICIWSNFKPCISICIWSTVFGVFDKYVFKYTCSGPFSKHNSIKHKLTWIFLINMLKSAIPFQTKCRGLTLLIPIGDCACALDLACQWVCDKPLAKLYWHGPLCNATWASKCRMITYKT